MTPLDRLRALHAAATPGNLTTRDAIAAYDGQFDCALVDDAGKVVAECFGRVAAGPAGLRPSGVNARSLAATHNALPSLLACVDALRLARQFIANGIELGYIKMPQSDTRDSARATLPAIDAALAPLVKEEP